MKKAAGMSVLAVLLVAAGVGRPGDRPAHKPDGDWYTGNVGSGVENRLTAKDGVLTWRIGNASSGVTIKAEYGVTRDSICYGVITKIECVGVADAKYKEKLPAEDDTFSFRFRSDDDELLVRDLKGKGFENLKEAATRYKKYPTPATTPSKDKAK